MHKYLTNEYVIFISQRKFVPIFHKLKKYGDLEKMDTKSNAAILLATLSICLLLFQQQGVTSTDTSDDAEEEATSAAAADIPSQSTDDDLHRTAEAPPTPAAAGRPFTSADWFGPTTGQEPSSRN
jgi:hypothetical protein